MTDLELLNNAIKEGIIDIGSVKAQLEMRERDKKLEKHHHKIWQGKNGSWFTYVKDEDGKRKLIAKKSRIDLEDFIIEHIKVEEDYSSTPRFRDLCSDWIAQKVKWKEISSATEIKYRNDLERFFPEGDALGDKKVSSIDDWFLEDYIKKAIVERNLTAKSFAGMRLLINGTMKYAKRLGHTDFSVGTFFLDLGLAPKTFQPPSEDSKFIYSKDERKLLYKYFMDDPQIYNLALALQCLTGLRIGELSTLKLEDLVAPDRLFVHRTETKFKSETGKQVIGVKEEAKQGHNGEIVIPKEAQHIIKLASMQTHDDEYLFSMNGQRLTARQLNYRLKKACEALGIKYRSSHKIRKTYASILLSERVDEAIVQKQMRHKQIETTRAYYYYNTESDERAQNIIERIVSI